MADKLPGAFDKPAFSEPPFGGTMLYDPFHGPYRKEDTITVDSGVLYCALCDYRDKRIEELQSAIEDKEYNLAREILPKLQELERIVAVVGNRTSTPNGHYTYTMEPTFHQKDKENV